MQKREFQIGERKLTISSDLDLDFDGFQRNINLGNRVKKYRENHNGDLPEPGTELGDWLVEAQKITGIKLASPKKKKLRKKKTTKRSKKKAPQEVNLIQQVKDTIRRECGMKPGEDIDIESPEVKACINRLVAEMAEEDMKLKWPSQHKDRRFADQVWFEDSIITKIWKTAEGEAIVQVETQTGAVVISQARARFKV